MSRTITEFTSRSGQFLFAFKRENHLHVGELSDGVCINSFCVVETVSHDSGFSSAVWMDVERSVVLLVSKLCVSSFFSSTMLVSSASSALSSSLSDESILPTSGSI